MDETPGSEKGRVPRVLHRLAVIFPLGRLEPGLLLWIAHAL